jgi:uncharacterized protein YecE (DUF72 family)
MTKRSTITQIDLFGGAPDDALVAPVPVNDAMRSLAEHVPATVRLGTSSWAFPGWQGLVYARQERAERLSRHGLGAYAQHPLLRSVGLDRTFYAPIAREEFAAYAAVVPPDFRFLVKAHAAVTTPGGLSRMRAADQRDHFLDAEYAAAQVVAPAVEGLGQTLGVLLFQFPPITAGSRTLHALPERLGRFLEALPRGVPYAVEVRNASLLADAQVDAYVDALVRGGATHGFTVHPTMPPVREQWERVGARGSAAGPVAVRWMLQRDQEYESARDAWAPFHELAAPDLGTRMEVAALVIELAASARPVIVIANNKAEGSAPRTLQELARLIAGPARSP